MAVEKYGRNRMNVEVSKLRSQLREVEEKCVDVSFKIRLQSERSNGTKMVVLLNHLLGPPKMADQLHVGILDMFPFLDRPFSGI